MITIHAKIPFAEVIGEIIVLPVDVQLIHVVVGWAAWKKQQNIY